MKCNLLKLKFYLLKCILIILGLVITLTNTYADCDYITDPYCEDSDLPLDTNIFSLIIIAGIFAFCILQKQTKNNIIKPNFTL